MLALLLISLLGCGEAPPPDDTSPWEAPAASCPAEVPAAPDLSAEDWTDAAPPVGGDVIHFDVSPANPDRIYAGTGQNGLFRSDDGGFTWTDMPVGIAHLYGQMDVSDEDANCVAFSAGSPYLSPDGGVTFQAIDLDGRTPDIQGVAFVRQRLLLVGSSGAVYATEDCGLTVEDVGRVTLYVPPPAAGHDMGQMSSNVWLAAYGDELHLLDDGGVLHASIDGGADWTPILADSAWLNHTLRIHEDDEWVVRQGSDSYEVQHRPLDGQPNTAFTTVATVSGTATNAFVTPDGEYLVSGSGGVWSSNRGEIGVDLGDGASGPYAVGRVGSSLLVGYRGGVAVSPDEGASWGWTSDEMVDRDIVNLLVHPTCPNVVFAGTQCRSGTFKSVDHGLTWTRATADMHYTMGVAVAPAAPEHVWAVTDDLLYLSTDLGETWAYRYPKGEGAAGAHYHGLGVSPHRPATVLVGSVGSGEYADDVARIYRTDNHGVSWTDSSTGLPASTASFHAVHWLDDAPGVVLLGTYRGDGFSHSGDGVGVGAYRSTDAGQSWSALTGTEALSWSHFAECDGRVYAATELGVIATDDAGDTWELLMAAAEGSEMLNVACAGSRVLAVDPAAGVFRSSDAGASWEDWTGSITFALDPWESQLGLELAPDGRIAYFTHPGQGVKLRAWE